MSGFTWLYSGHASTAVTRARNASRAAAGSGSRTTSCSNDIASLPHISASNHVGAVATTVTATVHSGGSTVEPAGRPQGSWPDVISGCTSGSAAGTSSSSSVGVTNRACAVVPSNIASDPGGGTDGDCVVGSA